ncbi:Integral membrane protein TerC [Solidesulfovibrio carbinoliphilus subsp. oakridgensis]|uniref:Integral membrane protein TerC n=1 Tax=Solidesulfovibrio carbinoliphilus subsp. oakridgensis TaxID=694327 RepID=G7Q616_9BACT|nr:TerC family protein [Solidesulfovibrio carbinoliphilus]EHJ47032.1 Integral membrane protein TerC [Solidesulfovibrio carbinoliphilus subsp. oakridgensis]
MALFTVENLIAFLTLSALEIVLGIDNIVFIAIITNALPAAVQSRARKIGLLLAMGSRIVLLVGITWVMGLTAPVVSVLGHVVTGRDIVLLVGGLFLIAKSTFEIHDKIEPHEDAAGKGRKVRGFGSAVAQIAVLDIVFSLDSVITAVGMSGEVVVMVAAVVTAVLIMMLFADPVSHFVSRHPTVQMLALSFLILIGVFLVAEGLGKHIDRGYIYFAMAFSLLVELLNIRAKKAAATSSRP